MFPVGCAAGSISLRAVKPDFAAMYQEQIWSVYGYLAYRLRSREEAEDLTQATFERALRSWAGYDAERSQPRTWLLAIAHNILVDHYRAVRVRPVTVPEEGSLTVPQPAQPGPEETGWVSPDLAYALERLSQRDREVIALRFGGDLTGREIAELLDLTLANVQQILSRSLRNLRGTLDERAALAGRPPGATGDSRTAS
jgi:RNA polymerase sigma factor (sigma-70 family)